ncbi:MAG: hypothetical protein DRN29_02100, partial [Thermoplasmata archaeon]
PVVEIIKPLNGSVVSGIITIQGIAWDVDGNESIAKVEIRIDGQQWKNVAGKTNWSYELDTKKLENGEHVIEARCYDGITYSNIVSIKINVQNEKEEKKLPFIPVIIAVIIMVMAVLIYLKYRKII